ncbi:hypothetical protein ACA910_016193 [Epithemia clementina (nom. ined.)]
MVSPSTVPSSSSAVHDDMLSTTTPRTYEEAASKSTVGRKAAGDVLPENVDHADDHNADDDNIDYASSYLNRTSVLPIPSVADQLGLSVACSSAAESHTAMCSTSNHQPQQRQHSNQIDAASSSVHEPNFLEEEQQQQQLEQENGDLEQLSEAHHEQQPGENQASEGQISSISQSLRTMALEERVRDLETKLLVLSRLLQIQRQNISNRAVGGPIDGRLRPSPEHSPGSSHPFPPLLQSPLVRGKGEIPAATADEKPLRSLQPQAASYVDDEDGRPKQEFGDGDRTPPEQIQTPLIRKDMKTSAAFPHLESPAVFLGMDPDNMIAKTSTSQEEKVGHFRRSPNSVENQDALDYKESHGNSVVHVQDDKAIVKDQSTAMPIISQRRMTKDQRNLSFKILYGGDEATYQKESRLDPNAAFSMTPAERSWLGASVIAMKEESKEEKPIAVHEESKEEKTIHVRNYTSSKQNVNSDDLVRNKWLDYLNSFQESTHDVDLQMEEFVKVPGYVEGIMTFGFFISVDSFLYIFTILPIRFVWSLLLLMLRVLSFWTKKPSPPYQFHRRHSYQMIQVFLLYVIYQYILVPISIGKVYHWIRGQAMIKLYVLTSIVELFDRLMGSLGQDCLDSMYWNAINRPKSSRMLISVAVVLLYETCHTLILFLHVASLNVAMNSADIALLTLFISGNFAEIKSNVFKKYNKPALFKMTAQDVCERFKLGLFLGLVLLLNLCQGMNKSQFLGYLRICAIVWCSELLADWIKHAFITKFNLMPAKVYVEHGLLLAGDFTGIGHEGVNLDRSHAVVKRIGLAQLPLVCVTLRLLREAAKYATKNEYWPSFPGFGFLSVVLMWLVLLGAKLALGNMLQRISWKKLLSAPEIIQQSSQRKKKL